MDEILQHIILPALRARGTGKILQDDNAGPRRAHAINDFLLQCLVNRMGWPGQLDPHISTPLDSSCRMF